MESFAYSRVFDNDFNNCGGRYENELSCVYIRTCLEVFRELVFTGNEHWRDANDVIYMRTGVDNGYVSAFWLDGLPFLNTTVVIDLTDNAAMGLPIGMRVTRADNMYGQLLYDSTPHYVFVGFRQIRMSGTWHYIVDGPPLNDQALSDDPVGTKSRYCDADCNMGSAQKSTLIVTLAVIFFILASCGGCIWFCCLPVPRYRTSYIESTGQTVPAEWSQARGYGEASARELSRRGELWPAQTRRIQQTRERTWANARETYDE